MKNLENEILYDTGCERALPLLRAHKLKRVLSLMESLEDSVSSVDWDIYGWDPALKAAAYMRLDMALEELEISKGRN